VSAALDTYCSFGSYTFCVTGCAEILARIRGYLGAYLTDKTEPIHAALDIDINLDSDSCCDGWSHSVSDGISEARYAQNGRVRFLLRYAQDLKRIAISVQGAFSPYLMLALQHAVMLALSGDCVGLHGVTLICRDQPVILSAPSGTGKTTLAKLLQKHCSAGIINGDFSLLTPGTPYGAVFEPSPFCGSSRRCLNFRFPIRKIVFLEQAPVNSWRTLEPRESMIRLMSNAFIPEWDARLQQAIQNSVLKLISDVSVHAFAFAPEQAAADMFYTLIAQ